MTIYQPFYFIAGLLVGVGVALDLGLIFWGAFLAAATLSLDIYENGPPLIKSKT